MSYEPLQFPAVARLSAPAALVPEQRLPLTLPAEAVCTSVWGRSVALVPSTRMYTAGEAACAPPAPISAAASRAPATEALIIQDMRATPFHEGVSAWRSRAGLLAYGPTGRAFPATRRRQGQSF